VCGGWRGRFGGGGVRVGGFWRGCVRRVALLGWVGRRQFGLVSFEGFGVVVWIWGRDCVCGNWWGGWLRRCFDWWGLVGEGVGVGIVGSRAGEGVFG